MATPENSFIAGVHRYLPDDVYKMKNYNVYTGGIADCWYSGVTKDLWIEYKHIVVPARATTMIVPNLSALQLEWLTDRKREGRNVAVVVGCKEGAVILEDAALWETGLSAGEFRSAIISRRSAAEYIDGFVNR